MMREWIKDYIYGNKKVMIVMVIYRMGNAVYYSSVNSLIKKVLMIPLKLISIIINECLFGIEIPFEARIGKRLRLIHLNGIVISKSSVIGDDCTIFHQVTLGANEHKGNLKSPQVMNNVYVGCGAKLIGNIIIGENVKVGANAVIVKSIPQNSTVICESTLLKFKN
ncbi:MAG: serine acetyltransferase [Clostridium sp.]